jgi:hypothetical protein
MTVTTQLPPPGGKNPMNNIKFTAPSSNSVGFCGLLALLFIALKLCSVIDWSWWWVLSPLWIPIALIVGLCIFFLGMGILLVGVGQVFKSLIK